MSWELRSLALGAQRACAKRLASDASLSVLQKCQCTTPSSQVLSRDRSHNYATQTMSNQMNLAGGLGQSLLNLFIQAALNQKVPAVCVDPDP
jgi:hypothetical protein